MSRFSQAELEKAPGWLPEGERPRCFFCGKPLRPNLHAKISEEEPGPERPGHNRFRFLERPVLLSVSWGYDGDGLFCTLRCGYQLGVRKARMVRASD